MDFEKHSKWSEKTFHYIKKEIKEIQKAIKKRKAALWIWQCAHRQIQNKTQLEVKYEFDS